jgi:PKD repeat protein
MNMKNANTLILIILVFTLFSGQINAQKQVYPSKPQNGQKGMIDTRVDNMGYWKKMAAQGLVPVAPVVQIPEAIYTGSEIKAKSVKGGKEDSPDVPVTNATNVSESENSVFVNPADNDFILNSNNSTAWPNASNLYGANAFMSEDAGLTWGGSEQGAGGTNWGDPTTAINLDGTRMYVGFITNNGNGQGVAYSTNGGANWTPVNVANGYILDKNHMTIDVSSLSPYEGYLYNAWTNFASGANYNKIELKRSTDEGLTWSAAINISSGVNSGSHDQGVNIQTGPNGEVYVAWAVYDAYPQDEKAIGFAKSTNGGSSFSTATRIINNIRGIRSTEVGKNHRVNSFPSMAVDISGGSFNGNIYIVWTNIGIPGVNTGTSADVYLIKSSDEGATWSAPIKVNQDPAGLGKKHYFPWIVCDPETGILSAVFYDDRNVGSTQCEVYCANSFDGGETWEDFKVSDVAFTPSSIPGLAGGYMGDYLGITARGSKVYPAWTDNRGGLFMTYTSPYVTNNLPKPNSLTVLLDENTGATTLNWLFDGSKPFLYFNVYRGGELLGTTTDLTWSDILPDYGVFQYGVTAMHDEGESVPSSASIQWGNPHIAVTPAAIDETLEPGASTTDTIFVKNVGELDLAYTVTPLITSKKKGKDYCDASGNCDEYISNVTFGDINNSSSCDNYHDYTNLSTIVSLGQTYPITISNGNPYSSDQCGIWVDWNHDQDFADAGETITVSGTPGNGPYTANIVPPAGAIPGETRLRVRITYTGNVDPCGTTTYGEVEDYSMYVLGWLMIDNYGGTLPAGDSSEIHVTLDAADLEMGVYTANINIGSNDPDMGMVTVPVTLTVGEQVLQAIFESSTTEACTEEIVNYYDLSTGGASSWEWTFEGGSPATSTNQNPLVAYLNPGTFDVTLTVSDGIESNTLVIEDYITISGVPEIPVTPTGENEICTNWSPPTQYTTTGATNAESYVWELLPAESGTILSNGLTATVTWTLNWEGTATIKVKGYNEICGEGEFSEGFDITCSICTGINEKADLTGVQIFPNPSNGRITISFDNNFGVAEISVMNMLNKVVYSGKTETMTGKTLNIDLSNLTKGVYFIKLKTDRQEETRKIIIQ